MQLFAAIGLDHPPHAMEKRLAAQKEHRRYVVSNDQPIALVGVLLDENGDQSGSLYLFKAESEQQVRDWFAAEPFFQADVYKDIIIRRFMLGKNLIETQDWPMAQAILAPDDQP